MNTQPVPHELCTSMPGYLPLSAAEGLDDFRVEGTISVRSMLRELMSARAHVVLHTADERIHLLTHIEALEAEHLCLEVSGDPEHYDPLLNAYGLTLVGNTGAVKIQLTLETLALREDGHRYQLVARIPNYSWRVQRRNDFRVMPPADDQAMLFFRVSPGGEAQGPLHDLSAGGLCFYWPRNIPAPKAGDLLRHCRIERGRGAALPCDLKVIRVTADQESGQWLISSRFDALPESVSRQIQIYVMDVERRIRAARSF